ncbi:jg17307, partial [Pararge aegeria aegeria]
MEKGPGTEEEEEVF